MLKPWRPDPVSLTEIDHIVLLVPDIDEAIQTRETLGLKLSYRVHLDDVGLAQAFFILADGTFIELIAPTVQDSIYGEMLRQKGEGLRLLSKETIDLLTGPIHGRRLRMRSAMAKAGRRRPRP